MIAQSGIRGFSARGADPLIIARISPVKPYKR